MKEFDWEAFRRNEIYVHTKTQEEADDFFEQADKRGLIWQDGSLLVGETNWNVFEERTGYDCSSYKKDRIAIFPIGFAKEKGKKIVEWSDYMSKGFTKADLKPFMLVVCRNGEKHIVTDEALVDENEMFISLYDISDTLENKGGSDRYDIMEVYPKPKRLGRVLSFDLSDRGEPIYVRKEVKKMTLREVCDKLGEEIELIPEEE